MEEILITSAEEELKDTTVKINGSNKSKATSKIVDKLKKFYYLHLYKHIQKGNLEEYKEIVNEKLNDLEKKQEDIVTKYDERIAKIGDSKIIPTSLAVKIIDDTYDKTEKKLDKLSKEKEQYEIDANQFVEYMGAKENTMVEKQPEEIDDEKNVNNVINEVADSMAAEVAEMSEQENKEENVATEELEQVKETEVAQDPIENHENISISTSFSTENNTDYQQKENDNVMKWDVNNNVTNVAIEPLKQPQEEKNEVVQEQKTKPAGSELIDELKRNMGKDVDVFLEKYLIYIDTKIQSKMDEMSKKVDTVVTENNALIEKNKKLEATIKEMEQSKNINSNTSEKGSYQNLEAKLNIKEMELKDKDDLIAAKDKEIEEKNKIILAYQLKEQMVQPEVNDQAKTR